MTIRITNAMFESISSGEFETIDAAYRAAVVSGLGIAADEVAAGSDSSIVQIAVDVVGRRAARRGSVAIATARLLNAEDG